MDLSLLSEPEEHIEAVEKHDKLAERLITQYLMDNSAVFAELYAILKDGWQNPQAEAYFQKQQSKADNAADKHARSLFKMMQSCAREMDRSTAFIKNLKTLECPRILDTCMALGGFLYVVPQKLPRAKAVAFTLPPDDGHKVMESSNRIELHCLDVTMLAADLWVSDIPDDHPEYKNFHMTTFIDPRTQFDLVICDGQVLRPQTS